MSYRAATGSEHGPARARASHRSLCYPNAVTNMYTIQQLTPSEVLDAIELWKQSAPGVTLQDWETPELILNAVENFGDHNFIAIEDGQLIGAVMGGFCGLRGLIQHLAVHQQHKHRGVGTKLMDACCLSFARKGIRRVLLGAGTEEAVCFYRSVGFKDDQSVKMMWKDV